MLRSRRTYEIANGWDGNRPVEGIPVVVLTHNLPVKTPKGKSQLIFGTNGVESAVVKAKALARDKHVGIGGASAVRQALRAGLVEEVYLHNAWILRGTGCVFSSTLVTQQCACADWLRG